VVTKESKGRLVNHSWSPDGKWLAVNDSEMRFRIINVETGEDRLLNSTQFSWFGTGYEFSPDSKWVAYAELDGFTFVPHLVLYNIETKEKTSLNTPLANDNSPTFSKDGRYLAFLSQRALATTFDPIQNQLNLGDTQVVCLYTLQKDGKSPLALKDTDENEAKEATKEGPLKLEVEGITERRVILPVPPGEYGSLAFAGGRLLFADGETISFYDLAAKRVGVLTIGGGFQISADQSKILVDNRVVDAAGEDVPSKAGRVSLGGLRLEIEPLKEWRQMYWEAWRLLRDYFYVANMHGLDWKAIGDKYAPLLDSVRSRDEVDILIRWLQAELGSSHQYLGAGDERSLSPRVTGAFLGIEVQAKNGRLQISKIFRGDNFLDTERSPLLEPGMNVKEGDYLLAIGGQELTDKSNYLAHLAGRTGQTVSVTISDTPNFASGRKLLVKPIANELRMKRLEWVEQNRKTVEKLTDGKVGYLYLGAMTAPDMTDFIKQYFPQRNKQAIIVDTRFNNGGNIQNSVNRILNEQLTGFFNMRASGGSWTRQRDYFPGHVAVLQNEFNVSCGEEFTHRFRDHKRGVIIGRRTYGGEVGSDPGWPLIDGGSVSVPNYGMWTPKDGWVIEGPGVEPDIDVESDPTMYAMGQDAQLLRAVEWTLAEIKRKPVVRPVQPADPVRFRPRGR
jgi:tricorn protease